MKLLSRIAEAFEEWDGGFSMTRVVAFMFAIVLCTGIIIMAIQDHLHEVGWPVAMMVGAVVFAVPVQALFKVIAEWLKSKQGKALLDKLINKVTTSDVAITSDVPAVTTTTTIEPSTTE